MSDEFRIARQIQDPLEAFTLKIHFN